MKDKLETLQEEIGRLKAENKALKRGLSLKVSQKGAMSIYGLGQFPVTLYRKQWESILDMKEDIVQFFKDNASQLKNKD